MLQLNNEPNFSAQQLRMPPIPTKLVKPHTKAREDHPLYLAEGMKRIHVPDNKTSWQTPWQEYEQTEQHPYNHSSVVNQFNTKGLNGWAAPLDAKMLKAEIKSYVDIALIPESTSGEALNPGGRTGIKEGRGLLGKPGPNFAADPIIFRRNPITKEVQVRLVLRAEINQWALPGGMVDYGETITQALARELKEETGLVLDMSDAVEVYRGYVDDPRNTDHAWMETIAAMKFIDNSQCDTAKPIDPSEIKKTKWVDVKNLNLKELYASHGDLILAALKEARLSYYDYL